MKFICFLSTSEQNITPSSSPLPTPVKSNSFSVKCILRYHIKPAEMDDLPWLTVLRKVSEWTRKANNMDLIDSGI